MASGPQNFCRDCGYGWFPFGTQRSPRCPACGGPHVEVALSLDDAPPATPAPAPPPRPAPVQWAAPAPAPVPAPRPAPPPPVRRPVPPEPLPVSDGSPLPVLLGVALIGVMVLAGGGIAAYLLFGRPARPVEQAAAPPPQTPVAAPPAVTPPPPDGKTEPVTPELPVKAPRPAPRPAPEPPVVDPPTPATPTPPTPRPEPPVPGATTPTVTDPPPIAPKTPAPPAPKARPPHPFPPTDGAAWESPWAKAGDVRVRVCGVGVTKVPLEGRKKTFLSPDTYFVVWVEVENTGTAAKTYRRWQPTLTGECTLRYATEAPVAYAIYPPETGREWFSDFSQPVPPGGPPLLESLVFSRPEPSFTGDLTLTLDATRVGATGQFTITIPRAVWTRRIPKG